MRQNNWSINFYKSSEIIFLKSNSIFLHIHKRSKITILRTLILLYFTLCTFCLQTLVLKQQKLLRAKYFKPCFPEACKMRPLQLVKHYAVQDFFQELLAWSNSRRSIVELNCIMKYQRKVIFAAKHFQTYVHFSFMAEKQSL